MKSASRVAVAAMALLAVAAQARAGPEEVVRHSNESVLEIYRSRETIDEAAEKEIFAIIDGITDYGALAGEVTERFCRKELDEEQCRTFQETFIRLLRVSSVKKLGRYRADRFEYLGEEVGEGAATVRTTAFFGEERVSLDYHLAGAGDEWRVVNYVVDGVDTIRNYRKQFTRLFARKSFAEVMARLEKRIADYEQEIAP